jgi:hypothetical protein
MRSFVLEKRIRVALLGLLFVSYFGSLWVAALHFPHGYDWRKNVISNLLSPRDNPEWYWVASAGVAMAGVCMLPLGVWIEGALGDGGRKLARWVRRPAFLAGTGFLALSALVVPQHAHLVLGTRHVHEILARTSAAGLGIAMLCACAGAGRGEGERVRAVRILWRVITVPPIAGAVGSGVIVGLGRLHALGMVAGYFRETVFWRLAFWEWVGSVAVFLFFVAGVAILGGKDEGRS